MSEQPDMLDLIGKHLRYIYSQLDSLSKSVSSLNDQLKDRSEGLARADGELGERVESIAGELARMEAGVNSLREVALPRSEFEEFAKRFTREIENRLPPVPSAEQKVQEGQT